MIKTTICIINHINYYMVSLIMESTPTKIKYAMRTLILNSSEFSIHGLHRRFHSNSIILEVREAQKTWTHLVRCPCFVGLKKRVKIRYSHTGNHKNSYSNVIHVMKTQQINDEFSL